MRYTEDMQEAFDVDWFATDKYGNVAHFTSAGGKLPDSVCASKEDNERLLSFFKSLPAINNEIVLNGEIGRSEELMMQKDVERRFGDFIFMSQRGLYSFDKKVLGRFGDTDFLVVSKPLLPLNVNSLPDDIRSLVLRTKIENDLSDVNELDVAKIL
jgi:hypothetical protein